MTRIGGCAKMTGAPLRTKVVPLTNGVGLLVERHDGTFVVEAEAAALVKEVGVLDAKGPDAALLGVSDEDMAGVGAESGGEAEAVDGVESEGFLAVEGGAAEGCEPGEDGDDCSLAQTETPRDAECFRMRLRDSLRRIQHGCGERVRSGLRRHYAGT